MRTNSYGSTRLISWCVEVVCALRLFFHLRVNGVSVVGGLLPEDPETPYF